MKMSEAIIDWSLYIKCPHCGIEIDLQEQDDDGYFSSVIFTNKWDDLIGKECYCNSCEDVFEITKWEY